MWDTRSEYLSGCNIVIATNADDVKGAKRWIVFVCTMRGHQVTPIQQTLRTSASCIPTVVQVATRYRPPHCEGLATKLRTITQDIGTFVKF